MQRYFAKEKNGNNLILYDTDIYHIKKVMRMKDNDKIEVVFDKIVYLCNINSIYDFNITIIDEIKENNELPVSVTVAISLVAEQKFDLIIQKLTELGVTKIIPLKTERSIVKLDKNKEDKKIVRWKSICKEASEQSHRNMVPIITNVMSINDLEKCKEDINLVCSLTDDSVSVNNYFDRKVNNSILVVIGPEGGITDKETKLLNSFGFKNITLGKRVLRVETAAIYVASIISYICEG